MSFRKRLASLVGPVLGYGYFQLLARTMRVEYQGIERLKKLEKEGRPVIFAFWHGRLAILTTLYQHRPIHLMISRHADGEIVSRVARAFNKHAVRGSTSRGGGEALKRMARLLRQGELGGITPDGPRGPRYQCQPGIIALAKMTHCPILPLGCAVQRKKVLSSWDRFHLPFPFNRAIVLIGEPIEVPADSDKSMMESKRQALEKELNRLTMEADRYFDNLHSRRKGN